MTFTLPDDQDPGNYTLIVRTDDKTRVALPLTVVQKNVSTTPNGFVIKRDETVSSIPFGRPDDVALVGDWDGDGVATPAVKRGNRYFVANEWRGGDADLSFHYGKAGDVPIVGDGDGDGKDTVAVRRAVRSSSRTNLLAGMPIRVSITARLTTKLLPAIGMATGKTPWPCGAESPSSPTMR